MSWKVLEQSSLPLMVCDRPHLSHVENTVHKVLEQKFDVVCYGSKQLYSLGYSLTNIITTLFQVIKIMTWLNI